MIYNQRTGEAESPEFLYLAAVQEWVEAAVREFPDAERVTVTLHRRWTEYPERGDYQRRVRWVAQIEATWPPAPEGPTS